MASIRLTVIMAMIFMACQCSISIAMTSQLPKLPTSTISAAPALLPNSPLSAPPALSPDVSPLFPSPGGSEISPTDSAMPTIPSSPSPPNPDDSMIAPGPGAAFSPFGSLPASPSAPRNAPGSLSSALFLASLAYWFTRLYTP